MTLQQLEELFERQGIDPTNPGFYDQPSFQAAERRNARFLDYYAEYVEQRDYSGQYLARARATAVRLADFLFGKLVADGRAGACIDISGAYMRMLEREGIWSYMCGGALVVTFPPASGLGRRYFWPLVHPDNPAKTGHMWVRVPPFKVVDLSLPLQGWDPRKRDYFPRYIAEDAASPAQWEMRDLFENELIELHVRRTGQMPTRTNLAPAMLNFMELFPPFQVNRQGLMLKYVPTNTSAMDGNIENMRNLCLTGQYPAQLWEEYPNPPVAPQEP